MMQNMEAEATQLTHCQYFRLVTLPHTHTCTMQISQTQINNARAVITPQSTVT